MNNNTVERTQRAELASVKAAQSEKMYAKIKQKVQSHHLKKLNGFSPKINHSFFGLITERFQNLIEFG